MVYLLLGGASRLARRPGLAESLPSGWLHVLFWAGLRGAVAVLVQGTTVGRVVVRAIGTPATDRAV